MNVMIEYKGQIVTAYVLRSWWFLRRVIMPVKGNYYRLAWIPKWKVVSNLDD